MDIVTGSSAWMPGIGERSDAVLANGYARHDEMYCFTAADADIRYPPRRDGRWLSIYKAFRGRGGISNKQQICSIRCAENRRCSGPLIAAR
jgi:hypothetical protein